jgi:hypothetical protein
MKKDIKQKMRIHIDKPYLHHRKMLVIVNGKETVCYTAVRKIVSTEKKISNIKTE